MPEPLEVEIKLALPSEAAHDALVRALREAGAAPETLLQRSRFFDGRRGELSAARIALRLREERLGSAGALRTLLTLKREGSTAGAVHRRIELEEELALPLDEAAADPERLLRASCEPIRELRRLLPGLDSLACLGGFENERKKGPVELDVDDVSGRARRLATWWEVDRTRFDSGPEEYELEVEVPEAAAALRIEAEAIAAAVQERLRRLGIPWQAQPLSKYARFRKRSTPPG